MSNLFGQRGKLRERSEIQSSFLTLDREVDKNNLTIRSVSSCSGAVILLI